MQLYDHEREAWVEVPEEQVPEALRSLRFTAPAGTFIPVFQDGKRGKVAADKAHEVFRVNPDLTVEALEKREKYRSIKQLEDSGVGALAAGGAGAIRGLSIGASDAIIPSVVKAFGGDEDLARTRLDALREEHPTASVVGEVVGAVAPAVASGGSSVLARGAAMTPAGVTAALGLSLERKVAQEILKKGANSVIAKKAIPLAAGAAAEGAVFGAGQSVTEAALGDRELVAQQVLGNIGLGTLLGGVTGGVLGSAIGAGSVTTAKGREALKKIFEEQTGAKLTDKAVDIYAEAVGTMANMRSQNPKEVSKAIKDLMKKPDRAKQAMMNAEDLVEDAVTNLRPVMDEGHKAVTDLRFEQGGFQKLKNMEKIMRRGSESEAMAASVNVLDDAVKTLAATTRGEMNKKTLRGLQERALALKADLPTMLNTHGAKANDAFFSELDSLKRDVGSWIAAFNPKNTVQREAVEVLKRRVRDPMEKHLERVDLWGDAGLAQKEVNAALHEYLNIQNASVKKGWFTEGMRPAGREVPLYVTKPEALRTFLKTMDKPNSLEAEFIRSHFKSQKRYAETLLKHYEGGEIEKLARAAKKGADSFEAATKKLEEKLVPIRQLQMLDGMSAHGGGFSDPMFRSAAAHLGVGGLVGGVPGVGLGAALYAINRPSSVVQGLAGIRALSAQTEQFVRPAAQEFIKNVRKGFKTTKVVARKSVKPLVSGTRQGFLAGFNIGQKEEKNKNAQFVALQDRVRELTLDPGKLTLELGKSLAPVSNVAPELAASMARKSAEALGIIHNEMELIRPERQSISRTSVRGISPSALRRMEQVLTVVNDPTYVPRSLANGQYLSGTVVQAWTEMWPDIAKEFLDEMIAGFSDMGGKGIPRQEAAKLSVMFGYPFDETYDPMFVARVQQRQQVTGKAEQPVVPGSVKRTDITLRARRKTLDDHQTGGQRLSNQEEIS